jgi:hypothetical protein
VAHSSLEQIQDIEMVNQTVEQKIDDVIAELSVPVSASESADGWTPESKKAIKAYFENLKPKLQAGEVLPPLDVCRGMDHWGVVSWPTLEKAAQISNELRLRRSP